MSSIITRVRNKAIRLTRLKNADTIATVHARSQDYNRLRERVCSSGTDSCSVFGSDYTHEGGLYLQQNPDEFVCLCLFLKERRPFRNYMEIGSASGGSSLVLYEEVGFESVMSLDDGNHPRAAQQKDNFSRIHDLRQFVGDSHSASAKGFIEANLDGRLDVAFIDGDHTYSGVMQDVHLTLPFCRTGALMIFHDTYACSGVRDTWLNCVSQRILDPLAEFIGNSNPFGIAVGAVI